MTEDARTPETSETAGTPEGAADSTGMENAHEPAAVASGAGELLRDALVDADDPRFPIWLPLPGIAAASGEALLDASAAGGSFLPTLLWPGIAIFLGTTLASWLGWQLDID